MTTSKKRDKYVLRVRSELIPESSKYMTFDDVDYLMIPVGEFNAWYETFEDTSIAKYGSDDTSEKPVLKTRKKQIPESGMMVFADRTWFLAVPVKDVQEWFEDIDDYAVIRYIHENPQPVLPWDVYW